MERWTFDDAGGEGRGLDWWWKVDGMEERREWASERAEVRKGWRDGREEEEEGESRDGWEGREEKGRGERWIRVLVLEDMIVYSRREEVWKSMLRSFT